MAVLYDYPMSGNGWKVRTLLRALGQPFSIRWVDLLAGEQHGPVFGALSPVHKVPVLVLDDASGPWAAEGACPRVLRESSAILLTLAHNTPLLPAEHRHTITEWLCFEQTSIDGIVSRARFRRRHPEAVPTPELFFDAWLAEGHRALAVLEAHLAERAFMVADGPSIADIALYAYTHCAPEGGYSLEAYPQLRAWHTRMTALPYVRPLDDNPEQTAPPPG